MKQGQEQRVQGSLKRQSGREGQWGCQAVLNQRSSGGARSPHTPPCPTTVTNSCPHCLDVNKAQPWQHVHGNLKGLRKDSEGTPKHPCSPDVAAGWGLHALTGLRDTAHSSRAHSDAMLSSQQKVKRDVIIPGFQNRLNANVTLPMVKGKTS